MNVPMTDRSKEIARALREIEAALLARPVEAEALSLALAARHPALVDAWMLLARARLRLNALGPAVEAARQGALLSPSDPSAAILLVEALLRAGRTYEALDQLERVQKRVWGDAGLLQRVGQLYTHSGRHAAAEQCYSRAVALAPNNPQIGRAHV